MILNMINKLMRANIKKKRISNSKRRFLNHLFKQINNLDLIIKIIMLNFNFVNKILNSINNRIITTKNRFNFIIFNNNSSFVN